MKINKPWNSYDFLLIEVKAVKKKLTTANLTDVIITQRVVISSHSQSMTITAIVHLVMKGKDVRTKRMNVYPSHVKMEAPVQTW